MIKILAIDDNNDNLIVLEALLSDAFPDSKVFTALSGMEGIKKAIAERPNVILLDLKMPGMDGYETCKLLKKHSSTMSIPVIILTAAHVGSVERTRALETGAEAFLSKPVDRAEIIAQLTAMIRIKQAEISTRVENLRLEELVEERTRDLRKELEERRLTEIKLQKSYDEVMMSRLAVLNLLEDVKSEMESRKHAEEELNKLNIELENRVKERTRQLETANRELEAFSYSISHDLRAPLRHIEGFAEILLKECSGLLSPNSHSNLSRILFAVQKMNSMIDDLLAFSRTGRTELKKSVIKMDQLLDDALAQIKPFIVNRKIDWIISELPEILGDYNLLRLAWINLVENAVKYTSLVENAVIRIGCNREEKEFVFFIRDNGVGFNMQYAEKLFGVFQRLHSSTQFKGTGIGLANVQRIILRHGGRIWADAEVDKGAVFCFTIPFEEHENDQNKDINTGRGQSD